VPPTNYLTSWLPNRFARSFVETFDKQTQWPIISTCIKILFYVWVTSSMSVLTHGTSGGYFVSVNEVE
jgi:hypothetical protein